MKKSTKKKLTLNKETVTHLAGGDLRNVVGGHTFDTCNISYCICSEYCHPES